MMNEAATYFYNHSEDSWTRSPYMIKEYTTYSECGKYAATVVVIPMATRKKNGEEGQNFIPMGVRIEHVAGRKVKEEYTLAGGTYFIKRKCQTVSEANPWTFQTQGGQLVRGRFNRPMLNKPRKDSDMYSRPLHDHPKAIFLNTLQAAAWAKYEEFKAAARAGKAA